MFGRKFKLFRAFGIDISFDISWTILFFLLTWSLAKGFFPFRYAALSTLTYWWMGVAGALGLFLSILAHELCHAVVARRYGMPVRGITLFIFGGVAELGDEPPNPKAEFLMAIVGPLASVVLGLLFYGLAVAAATGGWPVPVRGVLGYLSWINLVVAVFNMLPAFPLDGGRVLRSILWWARGNLRWATRVASTLGSIFGIALALFGLYLAFFHGDFIGGIWYFIIGMFLRQIAQASYQQLLVRRALMGETVRRFMQQSPVTVPPDISVQELVDDYIYRYHYKLYPVVSEGKLLGCIPIERVKEIPRAEWSERRAVELAIQCSADNTISPDADIVQALSQMNRQQASRLMVVQGGQLVGILAIKDLLSFLSLKMELDGEDLGA